ncbi:MAG: hypothetical protein CM15mP46_0890 [Alphaproteobacteria bacterium]|nr:MAG: hypothetical protein CM15mP46_0890 [Alphaproteobacteria bacterium]
MCGFDFAGFPGLVCLKVLFLFPDPGPKKNRRGTAHLQPEMMGYFGQFLGPGGPIGLASDDPTAKSWFFADPCPWQFCWTARRPAVWGNRPPFAGKPVFGPRQKKHPAPSWFFF